MSSNATAPQNLDALQLQVVDIAAQASHAILSIYREDSFTVALKDDRSPVTEADITSHTLISDALNQLAPQWPILSEEACAIPFAERRSWQTYWLVDPLDGTRDFVKRTDSFSVNIALIHQHQPVLGVIHLPVRQECYYASQAQGAFKLTREQTIEPLHCRKMNDQTPVVAVSGHRDNRVLNDMLAQVGEHDIMYLGSSIKSCEVAEGKADIYPCLGPTSEWDTAAAQCIVEEAGGRLVDLNNNPLRYNTKDSLTNDWFFACGDPDYDWIGYLPEMHR